MIVIITGNALGAYMAFASFVIGVSFFKLTEATSATTGMFALGIPALVLDLAYRLRARNGHWIAPTRGGMFMHIPIWIYGLLLVVDGAWCAVYETWISK